MKRIRKIVALALATVMMMAMSITAFAAENNTTTLTINNFPTVANGYTVNAYQIASVDENNQIQVVDWAKDAYKAVPTDDDTTPIEMTAADAKALAAAFKADTKVDAYATITNGVATFTGLKAGAYFFKVANFDGDLEFNAMVAVTVEKDANGNYVAKSTETLSAKSEPKKVKKEEDDKYSSTETEREISYTVETTIPYVKSNEIITKKFALCDKITGGAYALNADGKLDITVTYGDVTEVKSVDVVDNGFELDLNYIVEENAHANEVITFTYKAIALDVKIYNDAYTITPSHQEEPDFDKTTVYNYTGKLVVEKLDDEENPLEDAEFIILKKVGEDKYEYAVLDKNNNNKLVGWTDDETKATAIVTAIDENGKATASAFGFDVADKDANGEYVKNTYFFKETKAPDTWTINPQIKEAVFDGTVSLDQASSDEEFVGEVQFIDSKLVQLPFTGGMGTTIFTVLGVAIMAIAAALFFATKRKASK
ncbi:LPXTG cell wall anchor domain-containing protein [Pseudobutyrivibrio sp.]|jgi:LPXTG-motif cell wall-anchored protein|uniref:LPXTG cell wall anchor domain-containing protein n=1 Tax=Pseudobutyrivibrio sp. TaxID=2014367 RepID=UPI0025F37253|nr:LPXTG cell wall anchor domain-containing protein [Pseudobutyrivibrio sp.]